MKPLYHIDLDDDGQPDDVTLHRPTFVRIERMADGLIWMRVDYGDEAIVCHFTSAQPVVWALERENNV